MRQSRTREPAYYTVDSATPCTVGTAGRVPLQCVAGVEHAAATKDVSIARTRHHDDVCVSVFVCGQRSIIFRGPFGIYMLERSHTRGDRLGTAVQHSCCTLGLLYMPWLFITPWVHQPPLCSSFFIELRADTGCTSVVQ